MTQKIVLSADNAAAYAEQVEAGFSPTLAEGMKRIATEMPPPKDTRAAPANKAMEPPIGAPWFRRARG